MRKVKPSTAGPDASEEPILDLDPTAPAARDNVHELEINHPLITFEICALQNCKKDKMVVLSPHSLN